VPSNWRRLDANEHSEVIEAQHFGFYAA